MTRDLEPIRSAWLRDRPQYEGLVAYLKPKVEKLLKEAGVWGRVDGRPKDIDSLLKKCLRKPDLDYELISDKAGIRVVTRYLENLPIVCKLIEDNLEVKKKEDFTAELGTRKFGYQGIHLDVVLRGDDPEATRFGARLAEIQLRTQSQHLWCEMAHELNYKPEFDVPKALDRRVNCLSALIETCDREFSSINQEIMQLPDAQPLMVLSVLEKQFYKVSAKHYDRELSVEVIRSLLPLYSKEVGWFESHFEEFYNREHEKINRMHLLYVGTPNRSIFLYQPEALMIFDLLEKDPFTLNDAWSQRFPERELEWLAVAWGVPLR
jgi:ppGpp synthetase/RelA/SpoT-type nucleotidyltranferase